jgi:hypothetical protein
MEKNAFRSRLSRAVSTAIPMILIAAMPIAVTVADASSGGTGTSSGTSGTSPKYQRLWDGISRKNKRWARRTSECESGRNKTAHGGGGTYHGAFQFMLSTWRNAPKSPGGDPHRYSWRTQAVVAVYLKKREGTSPWPVCG